MAVPPPIADRRICETHTIHPRNARALSPGCVRAALGVVVDGSVCAQPNPGARARRDRPGRPQRRVRVAGRRAPLRLPHPRRRRPGGRLAHERRRRRGPPSGVRGHAARPRRRLVLDRAHPDGEHAKLSLTRHAESDLRSGPFLVEVRPISAGGHHGDKRSLPFTLRVDATHLAGRRATWCPGPASTRRRRRPPATAATSSSRSRRARRRCASTSSRPRATSTSSRRRRGRRSTPTPRSGRPCRRSRARASSSTTPPTRSCRTAGSSGSRSSIRRSTTPPVNFRVVVTPGANPPAEALALPALPRPVGSARPRRRGGGGSPGRRRLRLRDDRHRRRTRPHRAPRRRRPDGRGRRHHDRDGPRHDEHHA